MWSRTIEILPGDFVICRLAAERPVPTLPPGAFHCAVRTERSLTLVVPTPQAPPEAEVDSGWRALRLVGPLPLTLTGILAEVLAPLAAASVSVFPIAAWETDFVLVRAAELDTAVTALRNAGLAVGVTSA